MNVIQFKKYSSNPGDQNGSTLLSLLLSVAIFSILVFALYGLPGGDDSEQSSPAQDTLEKGKQAGLTMQITRLEREIDLYQALEGHYPPSLTVLAEESSVSSAMIYDSNGELLPYNPTTGKIEFDN